MKFGFYGINIGACANPDTSARISVMAEEVGFDSIWAMDHPVVPRPLAPPSMLPPDFPILDPIPCLSYLAGITGRIRLASGVLILPQRNPLILAKELASLDVLSKGRLILGAAVGYVPDEYEALGVPFKERGLRMDEGIDAIRSMWSDTMPSYSGRTVRFSNIDAHPRPVQSPCPPIVVGGDSDAALQRAVTRAQGWFGVHKNLTETAAKVNRIKETTDQHGRPAHLGALEISITPAPDMDISEGAIEAFAQLGVDRLILWPMAHAFDLDSQLRFVEDAQRTIERFA